jgi:hypothetical protein
MSGELPKTARHEVKFVAPGIQRRQLEWWVRTNPAGFYHPYPPRWVNNIYFDSFELFAYEENLSGVSARSKVRLRWYGRTQRPDSCVLEVKRKRSLVGWKISYPTGPIPCDQATWRTLLRELRGELAEPARVWLDANPQPVLINRYYRRYFVSRDGKVRLTLDDEQSVFDQRLTTCPNLTRRSNLPDTVVVEFKFAPGNRARGSRAIQGIPIRLSRNSKYVIAVQSLFLR